MELSPEGLRLILDGEVGGGRPYYDRFCMHPVVPGEPDTQSGVTIGIGFDLGQHSSRAFAADWGDYLSCEIMARLAAVVGLRGVEAKGALARVRDISIPWETALNQFLARSVPRYWTLTEAAFVGIETAPRCVREGLLSLIYNRGTSMDGDHRREMRTIRDLVAEQCWPLTGSIPSSSRRSTRTACSAGFGKVSMRADQPAKAHRRSTLSPDSPVMDVLP